MGLLILAPFFLIVVILIKLDSPGPAFFRQTRVGRRKKLFRLYKFRTMAKDAENQGERLTRANDPRITKVGQFLRKYKIDELPQLINVLKGEMSMVGPRPELLEYVELFSKDYDLILGVKPGITDFASIEFRKESELIREKENVRSIYINEILPQKIELSKKYVNEQSFFLDFHLIFMTLFYLMKK
jgi:lipopolysaccharide/colanic/teichoic acid biosynthesis glycosyltransferase